MCDVKNMYKDGFRVIHPYCDVIINAFGTKYYLHKLTLCQIEYFHILFNTPLKGETKKQKKDAETQLDIYKLKFESVYATQDGFEAFLSHAYYMTFIETDQFLDIREAYHYDGDECEKCAMKDIITIKRALSMYAIAHLLNCESIMSHVVISAITWLNSNDTSKETILLHRFAIEFDDRRITTVIYIKLLIGTYGDIAQYMDADERADVLLNNFLLVNGVGTGSSWSVLTPSAQCSLRPFELHPLFRHKLEHHKFMSHVLTPSIPDANGSYNTYRDKDSDVPIKSLVMGIITEDIVGMMKNQNIYGIKECVPEKMYLHGCEYTITMQVYFLRSCTIDNDPQSFQDNDAYDDDDHTITEPKPYMVVDNPNDVTRVRIVVTIDRKRKMGKGTNHDRYVKCIPDYIEEVKIGLSEDHRQFAYIFNKNNVIQRCLIAYEATGYHKHERKTRSYDNETIIDTQIFTVDIYAHIKEIHAINTTRFYARITTINNASECANKESVIKDYMYNMIQCDKIDACDRKYGDDNDGEVANINEPVKRRVEEIECCEESDEHAIPLKRICVSTEKSIVNEIDV